MAKPKLPKFGGERDKYQDWRAQYEIFVHQADVPSHFKMIMLKQALIGKALTLFDKLGYTDSQYDMAFLQLDLRYGGERRLLQRHVEAFI
jgi:aminoglycoside phosphotransferase family enzyme